MRQSVSKGRAALGLEFVICALASGVELAC